jgi:hypothetical protein
LQVRFDALVRAYRALNLNEKFTLADLIKIQNPEAWLRELMFQSSDALKALPLDKAAVLKMIKLPAEFQEFYDSWSDAVGMINRNPRKIPIEHFEEVDGGVEYADSLPSFIADRVEKRTDSPAQEEAYAKFLTAFELLQELAEEYPTLSILDAENSLFKANTREIIFNPIHIKNL